MVHLEPATPKFMTLFKKPNVRYSEDRDRSESGPSFPSGHVTDNFIIATLLFYFFRAAAGFIFSSRQRSVIREFTWARIGRVM